MHAQASALPFVSGLKFRNTFLVQSNLPWLTILFRYLFVDVSQGNLWPGTLKENTPFGQLPYMTVGNLKVGWTSNNPSSFSRLCAQMAQSMAMARFLARKAGLIPVDDEDFAMSEMLMEQSMDIYTEFIRVSHLHWAMQMYWHSYLGKVLL